MSTNRGLGLVELLVAAAVTGLLAAAVLTLLVGGAGLARASMSEIEAGSLARAAVEVLARDVARAGGGLGGERIAWRNGQAVPILETLDGAGAVRLLIPLADSIEVDALAGTGRYRGGSRTGVQRGHLVAGIGVPGETRVLLGVVVGSARGGFIEVAWAPPEARAIEQQGEVRALLPVSLREFETVERDAVLQLRRRDFGGRWQPAVDQLAWVRLQYACDVDGDGLVDGPLRATDCGAATVAVRVRAAAQAAAAAAVVRAQRWVQVGGR